MENLSVVITIIIYTWFFVLYIHGNVATRAPGAVPRAAKRRDVIVRAAVNRCQQICFRVVFFNFFVFLEVTVAQCRNIDRILLLYYIYTI